MRGCSSRSDPALPLAQLVSELGIAPGACPGRSASQGTAGEWVRMRAKVWRWLVLACVLACASPAATAPRETDAPATPSPPTVTPTPSAAASAAARPHVFVIVMENASLARALAAPDIATLAST